VKQIGFSTIERVAKRKRWPKLELKRLMTWNNEGEEETINSVKKSKKNANIEDSHEDESSYTTPIAGRLHRTRLPIARF
jgi:hypothetical protein